MAYDTAVSNASAGAVVESHRLARLAGVLYLLTIPTTGAWYGLSASVLGGESVTLADIAANRGMLEVAIVLGAIGHLNHLALLAVLHRLLAPFGKIAANLMFAFLAASVPLAFVAIARQLDLFALLDGAHGLATLGADDLQAQVALTVAAYSSAFNTQTVFWGMWLLPLGWLLLRSGLVPKALAVLILFGVPFYVMTFIGPILYPGYAESLFGRVFGLLTGVPEMIGEVGTALWLAIAGARRKRAFDSSATL